jgi:hypothetical protein
MKSVYAQKFSSIYPTHSLPYPRPHPSRTSSMKRECTDESKRHDKSEEKDTEPPQKRARRDSTKSPLHVKPEAAKEVFASKEHALLKPKALLLLLRRWELRKETVRQLLLPQVVHDSPVWAQIDKRIKDLSKNTRRQMFCSAFLKNMVRISRLNLGIDTNCLKAAKQIAKSEGKAGLKLKDLSLRERCCNYADWFGSKIALRVLV